MKKIFKTKLGESIILIALSIVNFIFTVVYYSIKLTNFSYIDYERGEFTFWTAKKLFLDTYIISHFNTIMIAAFCVGLTLLAVSALLAIFKNRKRLFYISSAYSLTLSLAVLFLHIATRILRGSALVCVILSVITSTATLIYLIVRRKDTENEGVTETSETNAEMQINLKPLKLGLLICECIATAIFLSAFVIPVYSESSSQTTGSFYLIAALSDSSYPLHMNIAFIVMFAACFAGVLYFVSTITDFARSTKEFVAKSQKYMYVATFLSAAFFALGYGLTFYLNVSKGASANSNYSATTVSYIPSILSVATLVAFSAVQGNIKLSEEKYEQKQNVKRFKLEPLIYTVIITGITFATLALNLVELHVSYSGLIIQNTKLSGYELLTNYQSLEGGFQVMAFVLLVILLTSGIMLLITLISYFVKNNDYYKIVKTAAFTNFVFMLIIGLFGIYFMIAQKINEENILTLLSYFGVPVASLNYVEKISSQSYIGMIAGFAMLTLMLIRGQFNLTLDPVIAESIASDRTNIEPKEGTKEEQKAEPAAVENAVANGADATAESSIPANFDVCPAFTELDMKKTQFEAELNSKRENLFTNFTLPNLVRFAVDYARECRLHLSYSLEDMATFVAGLGASRLSILQGMSGTGKTSLPKIFTEALMGNCEIVEVESSWRDKNELLGYYNEFSKCYTPKKFTQCLYKARLNSSVLTFIVLDEMNLSRIEYYFSDFLSLMENEEDKREIKLLNIKLFRKENGENIPYLGLTDGHTVKIPQNVWFIGTANRDESTFEISDKVYDRAQTMNFNKRAPKVHSFSEPLPQRFASYDMIAKLFDEAKSEYAFEAEDNAFIQKAEKLLMPYNISFGNRILKQMEDFVKIYCTCFGDKNAVENDAVEKILLSKVVSKLENKIVENKEALANEFSKIGLNKCSAFIKKLNED